MPYDLQAEQRLRLAEKLSYFMVGVQSFYEHDLGLDYIDNDPRPGTREELPLRIGYLEYAKERGRRYHVAQRLKNGLPAQSVDAIRGLLITNERVQQEDGTDSIEIFEFDVAQSDRGTKLGKALLQYAFADVAPDTTITLQVAEPNTIARLIYEKYGFKQIGNTRQHHGIFDVGHIPMATKAGVMQRQLGLSPQE